MNSMAPTSSFSFRRIDDQSCFEMGRRTGIGDEKGLDKVFCESLGDEKDLD